MMMHSLQHWHLWKCVTLFWLPFLHEDVAIVTAAAFIHKFSMPIGLAFGWLYAGVVTSDLCIYFLGRGARRMPLLRRFLDSHKMRRAQCQLHDNRVLAIICCRMVPGLLFSTFAACGWFEIPFIQFFIPVMITSMVYTGLALGLVYLFGAAIVTWLGDCGWIVLILVVVLLASAGVWRKCRNAMAGRKEATQSDDDDAADLEKTLVETLPATACASRTVAISERIPQVLFYTPLGLRWLWLSITHGSLTLPAVANPYIEAGGLWGESKSKCLWQIGAEQQQWVAQFITFVRARGNDMTESLRQALDAMHAAGLTFPIVAKPDVGWQGFGVRLLYTPEELLGYLTSFPENATLIMQQFLPYDGEAGVFYVRMPGETTGQVVSMTYRYFPHVVGDGQSNVKELIERDPRTCFKSQFYTGGDRKHQGLGTLDLDAVPAAGEMVRLAFIGSIRVGGLYRDASANITPALSQRFDAIATSMPEFCYGRFDVRFQSTEQLQAGEGFAIIEINGAGAEAIHMWDPDLSLREAYGILFHYQTLLFDVAAKNRARGYKPMSIADFYRFTAKQNRLIDKYPPSL